MMADTASPPRRFRPQPVEITTRSQRNKKSTEHNEAIVENPGREALQMGAEDGSPAKRRFRVEPVEVTTRSSRQKPEATDGQHDTVLTPPRSSPQPVELSKKSSRTEPDRASKETSESPRRFRPEPVEMSTGSNRRLPPADVKEKNPQGVESPPPSEEKTSPPPRKKFAPQLIETTKRSRKKDDTAPCIKATDKTEFTPGDPEHVPRSREKRPGPMPIAPENTPVGSADGIHQLPYERRLAAAKKLGNVRQHSWMPPALESIESSESEPEEERVPSLSNSPSASSTETADLHRIASRRETCDDRFSGYLLSLAAKAAEKQMREQAMAAFPNDESHEPVDHFAIDRESSEDTDHGENTSISIHDHENDANRRDSAVGRQLNEMQQHHASLADQRKRTDLEEEIAKRLPQGVSSNPGGPFQSLPAISFDASAQPVNSIGGRQRDVGLEQMRHAASPPMLGDDLLFRTCQSPQETKLDVDQYPDSGAGCERRKDGGGLWMGFCAIATNQAAPSHHNLSGLMTPGPAQDSSVDQSGSKIVKNHHPPSPESIEARLKFKGVGEVLALQKSIEDEFTDAFVTQVFNYLSLGYPSLARKFDEELSKISGIPVTELCKDDERANTKGYVGLEEGEGVEHGGACGLGRWNALKLYIFEWGRQHPGMSADHLGPDAWGVRARRGSWAL